MKRLPSSASSSTTTTGACVDVTSAAVDLDSSKLKALVVCWPVVLVCGSHSDDLLYDLRFAVVVAVVVGAGGSGDRDDASKHVNASARAAVAACGFHISVASVDGETVSGVDVELKAGDTTLRRERDFFNITSNAETTSAQVVVELSELHQKLDVVVSLACATSSAFSGAADAVCLVGVLSSQAPTSTSS